ncbi:MAG TPA: TonB family protein [Thermoanaerobaculia bacterium]|nr:TonB family protein [Thermoanaerobaculia bacterium]
MFEHSVVRAHAVAAPHRAGLVSVSLALHGAAVAVALAVSIGSVNFPHTAPDQFAFFQAVAPVTIPPPLGTSDGGARAATPAQKPAQPAPQQPTQPVAPTVVPDSTPTVDASSSASTATGPSTGTNTGPIGQPWGVKDSVGDLDAPPSAEPVQADPAPAIYRIGGDVKPPRVISRVEPKYPRAFMVAGKSAVVRITCVIDKDGHVQNPQIVVSSFAPFNEAVLAAIEQWRFAPGSLNGQAVDTYFDLTVTFSSQR